MKTDVSKSKNEILSEDKVVNYYQKYNSKVTVLNYILLFTSIIVCFAIIIILIYAKLNVSKQVYRNYNYNSGILKFKHSIEQDYSTPIDNSDNNREKHIQLFLIENKDKYAKLSFSKKDITFKYNESNTTLTNLQDMYALLNANENLFEMQLIKYLYNNKIYYPVQINNYEANSKSVIYYDIDFDIYYLSTCEITENLTIQKNYCYKGNGLIDIMSEIKILDGYVTSYTYKNYEIPFGVHIKSIGEKIYSDGQIEISFENKNSKIKYEASIDGGKYWKKVFKNNVSFIELLSGEYEILIREKNDENCICSEIINVPPINSKKASYIPVPPLLQLPELPTGCEITSLTMLLNYLGFEADKEILADKYLSKGKYRASDPTETFVGDPKSTFAYGCFSNVIVKTAEKYLEENDSSKKFNVKNITGCHPKSIYAALDSGYPVIVWITVDLQEPQKGAVWTAANSRKEIQWLKGEHCVLLTGYDLSKKIVYANDPLKGLAVYDMELFEKRFEQMNKNAVIIVT